MPETLHVGNIGTEMTDRQLHDLFSPAGHVVSARVMTDARTHTPRGFGLVEMATHEEAQSAQKAVHGHTLSGRILTVRPQPPRAAGWEGDNGRGGSNRSHGFGPGNGGSRW